jgi:hypothetical protein
VDLPFLEVVGGQVFKRHDGWSSDWHRLGMGDTVVKKPDGLFSVFGAG